MADKISEEKIKLFEVIIRAFTIAIKCSVLYAQNHPSVENSIKSFKENLDKWLAQEERLDVGIASDNLLLNQEFVREDSELFNEAADYLHQRGLVAISFSRGITLNELIAFFGIIKNEPKFFMQKGGIVKNMSKTDFIQIKEIDYSFLLNPSGENEVSLEDKDLWGKLSSFGTSRVEELPESSFEFIMSFLKDQKKSAPLLNRIYKDALHKLVGDSVVDNFRSTFKNMVKYLKNKPKDDSREVKAQLAQILSNLNPDFVANIFTAGNPDSSAIDLSKDFFNDLSDDQVADFMSQLMSNEGKVSENLFKLFDKLAPKNRADNLAMMLTDKLLEKKLLKKDVLTDLQASIKQIFEANSDNEFMSQMYKLTVDTLVDQGAGAGTLKNKYSQLVGEYENSLKEENLEKSKINLILNLLWLETDGQEYKRLSGILSEILDKLTEPGYIPSFKKVFEYFYEKIKPQQSANQETSEAIKAVIEKLNSQPILNNIISMVPRLDAQGLEAASYIIGCAKTSSINLILDAFVKERDPIIKDKFLIIIKKLGTDITEDILKRLKNGFGINDQEAKTLFIVLREISPEKTHQLARDLIQSPDKDIRGEALIGFIPGTEEEIDLVFDIFLKETRQENKEKMLSVLVKLKNKRILDRLFVMFGKKMINSSYLLKCVRLCGDYCVVDALEHLGKIISARPIFDTELKKQLRISAVVSLAQIGTVEAMKLVEKSLQDQNESVRKIAKLALGSYQGNSGRQKG